MPDETPQDDGQDDGPRPMNETLRRPAPGVIDQRQQQIDTAGKHRTDPNRRSDANRKQPGGSDRVADRLDRDER